MAKNNIINAAISEIVELFDSLTIHENAKNNNKKILDVCAAHTDLDMDFFVEQFKNLSVGDMIVDPSDDPFNDQTNNSTNSVQIQKITKHIANFFELLVARSRVRDVYNLYVPDSPYHTMAY